MPALPDPVFLYFTHQSGVLTSSPLRTSPHPNVCIARSRFSSTSLINREYSPHLLWEPPLLLMPALPAPTFPLLHSSTGSTHLISLNLPSFRCLPCQLPLFHYFTHQSGVLTSSPLKTSPPPDACVARSRFSSTSLIDREYSPHLPWEPPLLPMPALPAPAFPLLHSSIGSTRLLSLAMPLQHSPSCVRL